jgi:hypothetical protein
VREISNLHSPSLSRIAAPVSPPHPHSDSAGRRCP